MKIILTILLKEKRTTAAYNSLFIISFHTSMHEQVDKTVRNCVCELKVLVTEVNYLCFF